MKRLLGLVPILALGLLAVGVSPVAATSPACPASGTLSLSKASDKASYNIGDIVTFTITVTANSCDARNVVVVDTLPLGLSGSDPAVLSKTFGYLPAGTSGSYSFQAVAQANGTLTNTAHAAGASVGDDPLTGDDRERGCRGWEPVANKETTEDSEAADEVCPVAADASRSITVTTPQPSPGPQGPPGPPGPSGSPAPIVPAPQGSVPGLPNTGLA